ncbi:FkbM family methyltransferase [Fortiea contorta]|uniref:FkbM family methyltransferase n=1 Tax=Fortiea contorta TaxID=1892405 RepID=UPI000345E667|nr:FkbM family methyltransferase [Fortiea contorta]
MSLKQFTLLDAIVPILHKFSSLRSLAKKIFRGLIVQQPFHQGVICLDAVEHSWAWSGSRRYESFDCEVQDKLLSLSQNCEVLIDIGSNIGAMSLSVLLRNPNIKAVCIDPNCRAISLLKKSVALNHLANRVSIIEAAVSDKDGVLIFDEGGSVTGHISESGRKVSAISFAKLLNEYSSKKCLVKMDIEGFESKLLNFLKDIKNLENLYFVIELHPLNFNEVGNPNDCLNLLLNSGAVIKDVKGKHLNRVPDEYFTQVIAEWSNA